MARWGGRRAAGWLVDAGLPGSGAGVGSFVPGGFGAYARILNPARVGDRDVTWAEIACWSGRELDADCDSEDLMVRADGTHWESLDGHQGPSEGTSGLDPEHRQRLGALLADPTDTPDLILGRVRCDPVPPSRRGAGLHHDARTACGTAVGPSSGAAAAAADA